MHAGKEEWSNPFQSLWDARDQAGRAAPGRRSVNQASVGAFQIGGVQQHQGKDLERCLSLDGEGGSALFSNVQKKRQFLNH